MGEARTNGREIVSASRAFDVVALAASAGGLSALSVVLSGLPRDFPAPLVVLQHLGAGPRTYLPEILRRRTALRLREAAHGDRLEAGTVFVAPPGVHTLVDRDGRVVLSRTEPVNFVRPSADVLFGSPARGDAGRPLAVVLSGTGSDGAAGVRAVKRVGGTVIAQSAESSEHFGMPGAAIRTGAVDRILPLEEIPTVLVTLVEGPETGRKG